MKAELLYDWKLQAKVARYSPVSWRVENSEIISGRGVEHIARDLSGWEDDSSGRVSEKLFYLLLANEITTSKSGFFVCDICLLLANALHAAIPAARKIFAADWQYLPVAVLLAGLGHTVILPQADEFNMAPARELMKLINSRLNVKLLSIGTYTGNTALLAPFANLEQVAGLPESWGNLQGFLTGREDELGNASLASLRSKLLANAPLAAIVEMPGAPLQRAPAKRHLPMFAMRLDSVARQKPIHIAKLQEAAAHEGLIRQQKALELFFDDTENELAVNAQAEMVAADEICNLSWAATRLSVWKPRLKNAPRLGDFVQILRCQLARERIKEQEIEDLQNQAGKKSIVGSFYPDGIYIAREVNQQDMDPLTGILSPAKGALVRLFLTTSDSIKFILREKDILFAFRGTENGIGATGFVQKPGLPAIPSRYMYVIRALPGVSAIWLYYTLKNEAVRRLVSSFATGIAQLTINVDTLRKLPFENPVAEEVARLEEAHECLARDWDRIEEIYTRMGRTLDSMGHRGLFALRNLGIYREDGN